jgi:DeoR/GlpR family transcriptional regulator of sugar metabolism
MLARAVRSMLVVDASKFDSSALERICALSEIGALVTNEQPLSGLANKLADADVRVVLG